MRTSQGQQIKGSRFHLISKKVPLRATINPIPAQLKNETDLEKNVRENGLQMPRGI